MKKLFITILLFCSLLTYGQILPGVVASQGTAVSYNATYQAIYNVFVNKPTTATATAQNTMIGSLVDGGYWTGRIDLFYVFATDATVVEAKQNWANLGNFDLTDPGTTNPTFTSLEGFTGDGSTDYLSTGYIPATYATNISQNSISIGVYSRTDDNATQTAFGVEGGANVIKIRLRVSNSLSVALCASGTCTTATTNSLGFLMGTRRGAAEIENYQNGASTGTDTDASSGLPADDFMAVLADNDDTVLEEFEDRQISIVVPMNAISDADALAINTIIETYMDAIGKGVE